MTEISKRLKKAMALRNMKQVDLVNATGIGKSSISTYLSGNYEPKQRNVYKIAKALNVSELWLIGEDVPMEAEEKNYPLPDKNEIDAKLVNIGFNLLDDTDKGIIIGEIRNMLRNEKYKSKT